MKDNPTGRIVVLEPRRLAATLAGRYVAQEVGCTLGQEVGYTVRFENKSHAQTRVRFVTTGVLLRQLQSTPNLDHISTLVFDEFHERHLEDDLLLAWAQRLRKSTRPDLKVLVMSATLDPTRVAEFLDAEVVSSKGRDFPVEIEWQTRRDDRPMAKQVAGALRECVQKGLQGDVLVFLDGVAEIEKCKRSCAAIAREFKLDLTPLHGRLSPQETQRALAQRKAPIRKVLLSTNVAESSVTLDGVTTVIDSGLHKVLRCSPWSGLNALTSEPIPRSSADQRAGRAGRTAPGRCIRLYTQSDYARRPAQLNPELQRADIAGTVLSLAQLGIEEHSQLQWLDAPEIARWDAARELLTQLGAVDEGGGLTPLGALMAALPLHPRLSCLSVRAAQSGLPEDGALAAALLSEGVRLPDDAGYGDSDLELLMERSRKKQLPPNLGRRVARVAQDLQRPLKECSTAQTPEPFALAKALLFAFSDRVARRRDNDSKRWQLIGRKDGRLDDRSVVSQAQWLVALEATEHPHILVRLAAAIEPDWLLELPGAEQALSEQLEVSWNAQSERVEATDSTRFNGLLLDQRNVTAKGSEECIALLQKQIRVAGLARFLDVKALNVLMARRQLAHSVDPSIANLNEANIWTHLDELCEHAQSFKDLQRSEPLAALTHQLDWQARKRLDALAPERVLLAGGRHARVKYSPGQKPKISAKIQHFFGMAEGPKLGGGQVPVLIELLAPNQRPAQLTDDLAGFWERTWPEVRKELRGRYPKHKWPEDPCA
jgi:ATP-dependent helicase HrpB